VAQKYLLMVLGRSTSALDAVEDAMVSVGTSPATPSLADSQFSTRRMRLVERMLKESGAQPTV
jgi:hypothetical protein